MPEADPPDHVDGILDQWASVRPAVDVSAMAVFGRLGRLARVVQARLDQVFAAHDLEGWEFDVLATLMRSGEPHRLSAGDLHDAMMITSGTMTNRINRLEARGLVRRERNPDDGRQVLVALTAEGRRTVDAALVDHARNERDLLAGLTPEEQADLASLLRRLGTSIDQHPPS
ncbi:MarR family winged helix-turn-helix transcriptional regulator [Euzebya tangerina]|uniref:MarR family winged helix-turn-helix transcriptional regulator n=1 Tax=Euzebya tangerina TaxID=591198 RepID=UPI000E30EB44|nr:MarR family transcriptional regulator [Euzebya tangerina]